MSKKFLSITVLLSLTLVFGVLSQANAEENSGASVSATSDTHVKALPVEMHTKAKVEVRTNLELKGTLEAQREKMRTEAEARLKAAKAKGDEMQAKRETMKLEFEAKWKEQDAKRASMKAEFEAKRASSTERRVEWQQDIAKRKVENVTRVMMATIERLEKMILRIESRIAKVKAGSGATADSEGFVVKAKADLAAAKVSVSAFATIDLTSGVAKENFERVRTAAAEAREHIRAAHENMMLAVRSLRALEVNVTATSTTTTTSTTTVQ